MMVLLAHVRRTPLVPTPPVFGFEIGVDLFFVISGFVVALAAEKPVPVRQFVEDHLLRVLPLYYLVSLVALWVLGVWGPTLNVLWNTFMLVPVFDRMTYTNPVLYLGWSVAVEIWLYALVALSMALSRNRWHRLFTGLVLTLLVQSYFAPDRMLVLHFIGTPLMLEFLMGVWLCKSRLQLKWPLALAAAVLGAYLVMTNMQERPYIAAHGGPLAIFGIGMLRALTWGVPCAILLLGCVSLERCGATVPRLLSWFGGWSYSFYLVQPFSVSIVEVSGLTSWAGMALVFLAANCIAGYVVYRTVERPLMSWRKRRAAARRQAAVPVAPG
ncbi:acyltransferase [Paracidovorax citrulli]|nr:acyltransferase [Paracidovorax citrulli]UMT97479.1 acyltransferase [Paracidovorax citrulli]